MIGVRRWDIEGKRGARLRNQEESGRDRQCAEQKSISASSHDSPFQQSVVNNHLRPQLVTDPIVLVLPRPQAARRAAPRRADASAVVLFGLPRAAQAPLGLVSPPFPQPSSLAPSLLPPYIWLSAVLQCVLQCVQFKLRSRSRDYRPTAARRTELRSQSTHGRAWRIEGTDRPSVSTRGQGVLPLSP